MIERIEQPTPDSCWSTCISMLTGIDLDLLPTDFRLSPSWEGCDDDWHILYDADLTAWVDLMECLGYRLTVHDKQPLAPHIAAFIIHWRGDSIGHTVAVDNGIIIDPTYGILNFSGSTVDGVLDEYCNIVVPSSGAFITIEDVTVS